MLDQPASYPNPPDGAVSVRIDPVLSWMAGANAESHNVYFGTANPPMFQVNQTATTFAPGPLSAYTTYYWRIDQVNSASTITAGPVWTFTAGTSGGTR